MRGCPVERYATTADADDDPATRGPLDDLDLDSGPQTEFGQTLTVRGCQIHGDHTPHIPAAVGQGDWVHDGTVAPST